MVDEFPTSLNSNGEDFLFCKQNYIWLEQPRARCDDIKNHTRNGCKKIANPKSDYVTHEVSGKRKCSCFFPLPLTNKRTLRTFNTSSHLRWQCICNILLIFMITAQSNPCVVINVVVVINDRRDAWKTNVNLLNWRYM